MHVLPTSSSMLPAPVIGPRHTSTRPRRALFAAGGVAAAYVLAQLLLAAPGSGLGWDEGVYTSQVDGDAPAAYLSAPRARGMSYLVAPIASWTSSALAVHLWLALLSGAGVFLALWVWRKLVPPAVLGWTGALFCSLWITVFYGPRVMPNLWCALAALAAVGCLLRLVPRPVGAPVDVAEPGSSAARTWVRDGARGDTAGLGGDPAALVGIGLCVAFVALMRPSDAGWLALALGVAVLLAPGCRRLLVLGVVTGALALGCAPWIVEAYAAYGGLSARLHRASEIQGGMGWHLAFGDQLRSLQGRTLCRPCDTPWTQPHTALWWFALPPATAGGIAAALRAGRGRCAVLATVTALVMAVPYLFLIGYAAPRFLLPAYALLAVPVAELAVRACASLRARRRPWAVALGALAVAGHLGVQYAVLTGVVQRSNHQNADMTAIAATLHRHGVRPPCTVSGPWAVPVAQYAGCASRQPYGHDRSITDAELRALVQRQPAAILLRPGHALPDHLQGWLMVPLPQLEARAYLSPTATEAADR